MTGRSRLIVGGVVVVGILLIAWTGRSPTTPLDPDSTEPDGAKALVLLLDEFADRVDVLGKPPDASTDVAVLLSDHLSSAAAAAIDDWVRAGGVLVVTDPGSPFVPDIADLILPDPVVSPGESDAAGMDRGRCDLAGVEDFAGLGDVSRVVVDRSVEFTTSGADATCFGGTASAYVVMERVGRGAIVSIGGASAFANANLDTADNAVLAVALMVPSDRSSIGMLRRSLRTPAVASGPVRRERRVGDGTRGLFDLMPDYLRWVALDLAAAWLVFVLAKARRLGSPVVETQPVSIAGNELVRARGRLLRKSEVSATVAALANGFRSELLRSIGAPADVPDERLAELAAARCRFDAPAILDALTTRSVRDDRALVEFADRLDEIRDDVQNRRIKT